MASSWAPKTQATYNTELKKWFKYSTMNNINPHQPTFDQALDFLVWLHVDAIITMTKCQYISPQATCPKNKGTFSSSTLKVYEKKETF